MHEQDNDSQLRRRLLDYQEQPDENLWERIQQGADEDALVQNRLRAYSEAPDEIVWKRVNEKMTDDRYAAHMEWINAATLVLVLLLLSYSAFSPRSSQKINDRTVAPSEIQTDLKKETEQLVSVAEHQLNKEEVVNPTATARTFRSPDTTGEDGKKKENITRLANGDKQQPAFSENSTQKQQKPTNITLMEPQDRRAKLSEIGDTLLQASIADNDAAVSDTIKFQEEEKVPVENKKSIRHGWYALFMPTLGYQQIDPVKDDGVIIESFERLSSFSPKRLGMRVEVGWEVGLTPRLSVATGLLYYQRKQTFIYHYSDTLRSEFVPVPGQPFVFDVIPGKFEGTFDYEVKNIGMLLGLNYSHRRNRFDQKIGIAAELQRGLSREASRDGFYLFGDAYYRLSYQISERTFFLFQPTLNYALRLNNKLNAPFHVRPYGLGLSVGVFFKLDKGLRKEGK
jgi:hypothetical protein